jgi:uncharacterized membrane protein (UPF0136 family)
VKSLVANAALGIVAVASVMVLIVAHEVLATIAGPAPRFVQTRKWLSRVFTVLGILLAVLIAARFYYLRS